MFHTSVEMAREMHRVRHEEMRQVRRTARAHAVRRIERRAARMSRRAARMARRAERMAARARLGLARAV